MNEHLDDRDAAMTRGERELTLSTGAILGIFFGLVLLCGACFGVGYNMGRKSAPTPLAINDTNADSTPSDTLSAAKPAAGSPADSGVTVAQPAPSAVVAAPAPKPAPIVRKPPTPPPAESDADAASGSPDAAKPAATRAGDDSEKPVVRPVPPGALLPGATAGTGSIMVQVAAVSHKEDADLLVGALRSRGYVVSARPGASDGFIHVQVGPFNDKKAAEAMKQRLLSDGYNAILK